MDTTTSLTAAHTASGAVRTPWTEFVRKFRKQHLAMVAGYFVLFLIVVALLAPWIVPFDAENFFDYDALNAPPSLKHWFGVDSLGRDIFSRILMGARISLASGIASVALGALVGTTLGLLAGYYEGWWDRITMRICDVLFAFPASCWPSASSPSSATVSATSSSPCRSSAFRRSPDWCAATPWS